MTMVERVARAIIIAECGGRVDSFSRSLLDGWKEWEDVARAAIEAMRESTEAMDDAGAKEQQAAWGDGGVSVPLEPQVAASVFSTMIDAALKE